MLVPCMVLSCFGVMPSQLFQLLYLLGTCSIISEQPGATVWQQGW